ncbi:NTP transferase domain-containing protein [Halogeometricum borinquense]|uniref:NTP transferase domain-containing protein n=1 Tax=Halogeometricum borinquense TaxID=60847 RepID=A0A6C0UR57_9EURY|nr:NTP transferase domain-containing protein [Halogeometricum borinquense]QIB76369.1 NTP transferase domain-containing protein [Halogeometricum borinquense]QIQ77792.1 NTP transferase domain-containing protein [Halogeometricum borinquense]
MCGGQGTRLGGETEKPLVRVCGVPMVDRVATALRQSRVETVHAVVSPDAPETARHVREKRLSVVETAGEGYVSDLTDALEAVGKPVVTVAADLPLLAPEHVDSAIETANAVGEAMDGIASVTVCVPANLKRRLGVSADTTFEHEGEEIAPTGLNVVAGATDTVQLTYDDRIAVNVNRPTDLELAEERCD